MADQSYTRRFSDVYLKELEDVAKRRADIGIDRTKIDALREETSSRLAEEETDSDPNAYEPPPTVLTAIPDDSDEDDDAGEKGGLGNRIEEMFAKGPVGLALSGGGIRSATFNLGLLQALARQGILRFCDYLSTVSGGGYIGSCLSSLLESSGAGVDAKRFPFRFDREKEPDERKEVKWLREHGKYLAPNTSLFGLDIWRMVGVQVSGIALTNIVTLAFVLVVGVLIHQIHRFTATKFQIHELQSDLFTAALAALGLLIIIRGIGSFRNLSMPERQGMRKALAALSLLSAVCAFAGLVVYLGLNLVALQDRLQSWLPSLSVVSIAGMLAGLIQSENKTVKKIVSIAFRFGWVVLLPIFFGWVLRLVWLNRLADNGVHVEILGLPWELPVAAVLFIVGCFVNTNRISGHHFYRDRLSLAYIVKRRNEQIVSNEAMTLTQLHKHDNGAPYHLINATLNVHGSKSRYLRGRGAEIFEFAKRYVGANSTGYRTSETYEDGDTRLATVMAVSGAAASPQMGTMTNRFLALLMALLNVRLNRWMPNPQTARISIWPYYFLKELLGSSKESDGLLNLSDGGHYENLGVYGLIKRGCRFIIASDAAADPSFGFADFASLQRKVRIDLGVGIEIKMDSLRLGEDRLCKGHHAVGTIHYPNGMKGVLVYIKTSLTGDESEDLLAYRRGKPDFPDESTADQFFDEAQFESYRKLGEHVGNGIFEEQDSH